MASGIFGIDLTSVRLWRTERVFQWCATERSSSGVLLRGSSSGVLLECMSKPSSELRFTVSRCTSPPKPSSGKPELRSKWTVVTQATVNPSRLKFDLAVLVDRAYFPHHGALVSIMTRLGEFVFISIIISVVGTNNFSPKAP